MGGAGVTTVLSPTQGVCTGIGAEAGGVSELGIGAKRTVLVGFLFDNCCGFAREDLRTVAAV